MLFVPLRLYLFDDDPVTSLIAPVVVVAVDR